MLELPEEKEKQLIVTLALIQKALQDLVDKVNIHQKILFGNGDPQNSVTWGLKELSSSVKRIENQFKDFIDDAKKAATLAVEAAAEIVKKETLKSSREEDLTWSQTLKKILIKAPYVIAIITSVALINKPASELMLAIVKLITGK